MTNDAIVKIVSRIASFIDSATDELLEFQSGEGVVTSSVIEMSGRNFNTGDHIPEIEAAQVMLNSAYALIQKLSAGSTKKEKQQADVGSPINDIPVEPFSPKGTASLILDITQINANGESIHRILYSLIDEYGEGSGVAESSKAIYNIASTAYAELQRIIPKFLVSRGSLPAVNSLKPLTQAPVGYSSNK